MRRFVVVFLDEVMESVRDFFKGLDISNVIRSEFGFILYCLFDEMFFVFVDLNSFIFI